MPFSKGAPAEESATNSKPKKKKFGLFGSKKNKTGKKAGKKFNEKPQVDPTEAQELKIASKTLRKLNVKEIIPSAAISLAQKAAGESHSLVVEVPQAHGFLVVCIDGFDIHDVVKIDNPKAENYDKQEVGQLSQLLIDNRKIASVTLAQDRANGFIALLPTQTTLENLMSIDSFADTADKKLFTWALLPNDIDENSPLNEQATRSINDDQCHASLNELLEACRDNTKPEFDVEDGKVTNVKIFDVNSIKPTPDIGASSSVPTPDNSTNTDAPSVDEVQQANESEQSPTDDNKSADTTSSEDDLINSVSADLGLDGDPFSGADDSPVSSNSDQTDQSNINDQPADDDDPFGSNNESVNDQQPIDDSSADPFGNDEATSDSTSETNDDDPFNESSDDTSSVNNDLEAPKVDGKFTSGRYKGLTEEQANLYIVQHGFDATPTQAEIDELSGGSNDEASNELRDLVATDEDRRDDTVKALSDFQLKSSDNELDIVANDNAIEQMLDQYDPYQFAMQTPESDHDTLTQTANEKRSIMNDEMKTLHEQNKNAIITSFHNNVRKLMNNTQKLFSLSNMNNYGKVKRGIDNDYETKRAELQPAVDKKIRAIDVQFQKDQEAVGEAAKQQAILQYQREYQPLIDQKKAAVPDEVYRSITYDREHKLNTMRIDRKNQAHDYFDDKFNQLVVLYTDKYKNGVIPSEKSLFDHHQKQLDEYLDANFNKQAQQNADLAEIARHDNQIHELTTKLDEKEASWKKKYKQLQADDDAKIKQIVASAEQDSAAKDQEYRDKLANVQAEAENAHQADIRHLNAMHDQEIQELKQNKQLSDAANSDKIRALENQVTELQSQVNKAAQDQEDAVAQQRKADEMQISSLKAVNDATSKRLQDSDNALNAVQQQLMSTQKHQGSKLAIAAIATLVIGGAVGAGTGYAIEAHHASEIQQEQVQKQQAANSEKQEEQQNNNNNRQQQTQPIINYNVGGGQQTPKGNSSSNK